MPTWIRCRDADTGHEFDLRQDDSRIRGGSVKVLKNYPQHSGASARPRPAKHRIDKSGRPARNTQAVEPAVTIEENEHGASQVCPG